MKKSLLILLTLFSFSYAELDKDTMQIIRNSLSDLTEDNNPLEKQDETKKSPKIIPDANFVNGIAILVNTTPITLYDIEQVMAKQRINKSKAASILIDKALYDEEIKNKNVTVDIFDIDQHIEKLATNNNMNILDFKSLVREQQDYSQFKAKIKQQLMHQKLLAKIAKGKLAIATDSDLRIYYNNNKEEFQIANKVNVMAYVSKNKRSLQMIQKNPMFSPSDVVSQSLQFTQSELNPQVKYILNSTKKQTFSIIFAQNKNYNMFYVKDKQDVQTIPFEQVKDQIFSKVMQQREQDYLKEHFETLKMTADIRIIR